MDLGVTVAPETTDAITATRFLRSKGLRRIQSIDEVDALAQAAVTMYQNMVEWRRAEKIEELLQEPPLPVELEMVFVRTFNPRTLDGHDFHGRPVLFFQPTDLDFNEPARPRRVNTVTISHSGQLHEKQVDWRETSGIILLYQY